MQYWPYVAAGVDLVLIAATAGHAILYKRDTRAAIAWVGLIWLVPIVGALLYVGLGINRIQRRAHSLRGQQPHPQPRQLPCQCSREALELSLGSDQTHLERLAELVRDVTGWPLVTGNRVAPLINGDQAFPAMIAAIDAAARSITLSSYIFDNDSVGRTFVEALQRAQARGVKVRVLVDDVGARFTWPTIARPLRRAGIPCARFMPTLIPWRLRYANLRNHRKIMVVDGTVGFTGGMNIRAGNLHPRLSRHAIADLHFQVNGPVVAQLQQVFAEDWAYSTGELLQDALWFPQIDGQGSTPARGIADGPDESFDRLRMVLLGAIACAQSSVQIVTPYFLPDAALITALSVASLRGVKVEIILPEKNNLRLVQWASTALLWQVLERGCRVYLSPPPFDHSKLMLVDRAWTLFGSTNWDPRSLRLNFEFNVECYDAIFAGGLAKLVEEKRERSREVTLADVDGRRLPVRLRDGIARLFSPYL